MPPATDTPKIDPVVQEQLSVGEATLAEFMDGLSKTISRYNTLLAKALPQNPKAHFYYYNEEEGKEQKEGESATTATSTTGDASSATTEAKKAKTEETTASETPAAAAPAEGEKKEEKEGKKPTSPLLRRPQLPKEELAKIKDEAKRELLKRQSSVGDFPIVGDEEEKTVKAHTSKSVADKKKKHQKVTSTKKSHKKGADEADEEAEEEEEKEEKTAKKKDGKGKSKKEPKSILPKMFGEGKKKKKKASGEEEEEKAEPTIVLTAEEAAADADEWEDETDEEAEEGAEGEMTVEQLFAKIAPSPQLLQEIRVLKTEARELNLKFEIIHDWIAMNMPALATEDAEGTTVMAAVIESLTGFMATIEEIYSQEASYLAERAGLELSFLQNPEIATGLAMIAIHDNDAWDSIEVGYRALIRCYLIAHSQLSKNMEQLRAPVRRRINLSM